MKLSTLFRSKESAVTAVLGGIAGAAIVTGATVWLPFHLLAHIALLIPSFVITAALSSWCAGGRTAGRTVLRAIAGGAFTAATLAGVYLAFIVWLHDAHGDLGTLVLYWAFGLIGSFIFLSPVGAVVSLVFLPMLLPAREARANPSLGAADHMLVRGGLWLGFLGFAAAGLDVLVIIQAPDSVPAFVALGTAFLVMLVGIAAIALGDRNSRRRVQWLADVRAGAIDGFRIVPLEETGAKLLPLLHDDVPNNAALVRVYSGEALSYREAATVEADEPIALVRF